MKQLLTTTLLCVLLGLWVKEVSSRCGPPELNRFGSFSPRSSNYSAGSSVVYKCNDGYQLHGNATRECLESNLWSGSVPYCWASNSSPVPYLSCTRPNPVENGQIQPRQKTKFDFNENITHVCNRGYCLEGDAISTCRVYWTPPPVCKRCAGCGRPDDPPFGSVHSEVNNQTQFALSEGVTYRCSKGYILDGSSSVYCTNDGWTHEPTCLRGCSRPDDPPNGSVHSDVEDQTTFAVDEWVIYRCNERYFLQGSSSVYCRNDGWTHIPTCSRGCSRPDDPPNGSVHSDVEDQTTFAVDEWVIYRCNERYFLQGSSSVYCRNDGWTHTPTCTRAACGKPPTPKNGLLTSPMVLLANLYAQNSYVDVVCNEGYCINGDPKIQCTADGWSHSPMCERCCLSRQSSQKGQNSDERNKPRGQRVGTTITYACGPGNYLSGSAKTRCQADGTWDFEVPTCRRGCNRPKNPQFGSVHSDVEDQTQFALDEWVIYRCNEGYGLNGDSSVYCRQDGWTHEPTCTRRCYRPDNPPSGSVHSDVEDQTEFAVNERVIYRCNEGYSLLGNSSVYCKSDGWTHSPTCIRLCDKPSSLTNGYLVLPHQRKQRFLLSESVAYFCNPGYRQAGPRRVYCRPEGWSHTPACTKTASCPSENIQNGYHVPRARSIWSSGQVATYECNDNYNLVGDKTSTCQDDGSWSSSPPICRPLNCGRPTPPINGFMTAPAPFLSRLFSLNTYMVSVCLEGFCLVGNRYTHCLPTGWSPLPTCERCCPERDPPANGYANNNINQPTTTSPSLVGSTINYGCNPGYNLVGSATVNCLANGNWDVAVPTCSRAIFVQSCEGRCGSASLNGCNCDQACISEGDCCNDFARLCRTYGRPPPTRGRNVRQNAFRQNVY